MRRGEAPVAPQLLVRREWTPAPTWPQFILGGRDTAAAPEAAGQAAWDSPALLSSPLRSRDPVADLCRLLPAPAGSRQRYPAERLGSPRSTGSDCCSEQIRAG